jgi:hypothetical protein
MIKPPRSPTQIALEKKSTGDSTIDRLVQDYIQNVVAQFGGWKELTAGEFAMLLSQKICLEAVLKCQSELSKEGAKLVDDAGKPSQLIWIQTRFLSEFRAGQIGLGLARPRITTRKTQNLVGQPRDSIAAIIEEYNDEKRKNLKVV